MCVDDFPSSESATGAQRAESYVSAARRRRFLTESRGLRALLKASQFVTEELDLEDVLRSIVESAITLVDAQYGAIGVMDPDGHLDRFIPVGMPADVVEKIGFPPQGRGVLEVVNERTSPTRLDDLTAHPRAVGFPEHHPTMRTFLGVPITIGGQHFGNLYLTNRSRGVFTDDDEDLVTALAAAASTAISNARLYDQAQRAQRVSAAVGSVTAALLESAQNDVFGVLAAQAAELTDADLTYIVLSRARGTRAHVAAAYGERASAIQGTFLHTTDSVLTRALAGEQGLTQVDSTDEPLLKGKGLNGSTIAVPLVVSGAAVGALGVTRGGQHAPFTPGDLGMVSDFAAQAGRAVALAQARIGRQRLEVTADRERTARDLHDHVIQRLFGTGLGLQALAGSVPSYADVLEEHVSAIDAAIVDIRSAIFTLTARRPSQASRYRILDAVTELGQQLPASPRVTLTGPIDLMITGQLVDDVVAVIREALANVVRHADAETVEVAVVATETDITVTVSDDGIGVPYRPAHSRGVANLSERAAAHGGTFDLEPLSSGGSRARWQAPLSSELNE